MIGKTLGNYDVIGPLGAGGMGEVYRGRDRRLDREVAIKVLPAAVAGDPERLTRFEREARLLASLNHPNIGSIYGLEQVEGITFLALELVEGSDLSERLASGRLPTRDALHVCRQIARALEAAHAGGIVHRDLKPSNVKVTPGNAVKVLDFGLAKAIEPVGTSDSRDLSLSPTVARTQDGIILGTAAYMSPEQARGQAVDHRTDIWAFGCVLYETLTGHSAFGRETLSDILVAILEREPDWSALPADVPRSIRRLLRRCLSRDQDRRLHHIADARLVIEDAMEPQEEAAAAPTVVHAGTNWMMVAGVAMAAAMAGYAARAFLVGNDANTAASERLHEVVRVTHGPGISEWPTWSPDGQLLALASNHEGDFDIYVRRGEGGQEVNVTDDPGDDFQPSFSPDGEWIAFVSTRSSAGRLVKIGATFGMEFRTYGGDVWVVPALGGRARRLAEAGNAPAWHPSEQAVMYVSGPEHHRAILQAGLDSGRQSLLAAADSAWEIVRVQYSPDARWVTFDTVNPDRVMIMPAAGGEVRELLGGVSHAWHPSGDRLYYLSRDPAGGTRLLAVDVDGASGQVRGAPVTVGLMTGILRDLTLAPDGNSFAAVELEGSMNLTMLPLNESGSAAAGDEVVLSPGQVIDRYPHFSADGTMLALASNRLGREEVWLFDRASGSYERLELPGEDQGVNLPFFSPDGREVYVTRFFDDGRRSVWRAALDGSGADELVSPEPRAQGGAVSGDGGRMIWAAPRGDYLQLMVLDVATGESAQLTDSPGDKESGEWSPDGKAVIYNSNATGAVQLWEHDLASGEERQITDSRERIRHAFFSPDGRWLYFQPNHLNIYRMPAGGGDIEQVTRFPESGLFLEEPAISPDGRFLAYSRSNGGSSVWVLRTATN